MKTFVSVVLVFLMTLSTAYAQGTTPRPGGSTVSLAPVVVSPTNITAEGQSVSITMAGYGAVGVTITGTWTGTLTFQVSADGTNYEAVETLAAGSSSAVTTTTGNGTFSASVGGFHSFRVIATAAMTGTATISLRATLTEARKPAGSLTVNDVGVTSIAAGDNNIGNVDVVSSALPTGAATAAKQDTAQTSFNTLITSVSGIAPSSTGTASLLMGGVYNSTPPTFTDGQKGSLQLDATGALKISGGGGGTQYANGTAAATPTGNVFFWIRWS